MSKKKLIDAEKLESELLDLSNDFYLHTPYYSTPHSDDPLAQAIYGQIDLARMQSQEMIKEVIRQLLQEISWKINQCTYEDHPCLMCRDDDDMSSPVEDFGDWRESQKIANSK